MSAAAPKVWITLAKAHRAMNILAERSIAGTGLCISDFMILEALLHKGPLTITEIQDKILLATGSMTAAVDRVENKGLIVRKTTKQDRRARILELTPEGRTVAKQAFRKHTKDLDDVMSVLSESEMETLRELLKKLGLAAADKNAAI